ncbi:MAG: TlpA family protein disulfide reductase, partial [Bacteroidia bacterium]
LLVFCTPESKAQNAEKLLEDFLAKMAGITSGELNYTIKWKPFLSKDTVKNSVNLSFFNTNNGDSFLFTAKDDRTVFLYDFENLYRAFVKTNKLYVRNYEWKDVYANFYFTNYIPVTTKGKLLLEQKPQQQFTASDTVLPNGKAYKLLHLYIPFEGADSNAKNINYLYFLEPGTLIPQKYIFTVEGLGDNQHLECNLISYKLNHLKEKQFRKTLAKKISDLSRTYDVIQNQSAAEFNKRTLDSGAISPDFSLNSYAGDSLVFPLKKAKVYLLDFWYVRCYPCQLAIPHLQKLYMQYAKNGLEVIGINTQLSDSALLPALVTRLKFTYPIGLNGKSVAEKYGVKAYPTIFLVNREGKIIYRSVGFSEDSVKEMEEIIKQELAH